MEKKKKDTNKQLDLGLPSPFTNELAKIKTKTQDKLTRFELMKYAKDGLVWFFNTLAFCLIGLQGLMIYLTYSKLPRIIPLLNFPLTDNDRLVGREFIVAIPVFSLIFFLFSTLSSYKEYNREKELMRLLVIISTLSILFLTLHIFNQVYKYL